MKLKIYYNKIKNAHFIGDNNKVLLDRDIAQLLGISYRKYGCILKKYNAFKTRSNDEYWFHTRKDAKRAKEELEPYLIMKGLLE